MVFPAVVTVVVVLLELPILHVIGCAQFILTIVT
nr:MAG TPA: hypothetical protein [Caudoviricetes sp.]